MDGQQTRPASGARASQCGGCGITILNTMDLISLKKYLRERKTASLHDLLLHFRTEASAIQPLLETWISKGKVKKHSAQTAASCKGCCKCDPATLESYEWIG